MKIPEYLTEIPQQPVRSGDPERLAAARVLLGAGEGFPETVDETLH